MMRMPMGNETLCESSSLRSKFYFNKFTAIYILTSAIKATINIKNLECDDKKLCRAVCVDCTSVEKCSDGQFRVPVVAHHYDYNLTCPSNFSSCGVKSLCKLNSSPLYYKPSGKMDRRYVAKSKRTRRKHLLPYRKWSDTETTQLIEYMKSHVSSNTIEKPTSRVFYTDFIEKFGLDANWVLVKNKVRNLREKFLRAVEWKASVTPNQLENEEFIPLGVRRMCPYFEDLNEVFGKREMTPNDPLEETESRNYFCDIAQSLESPYDIDSAIKIEVEEQLSDGEGSAIKIEVDELRINGSPARPKKGSSSNPNESDLVIVASDEEIEDHVFQSTRNGYYTNATTELAHSDNVANNMVVGDNIKNQVKKFRCACVNNFKELTAYQKEVIALQKAKLALDERRFLFEKEKTLRELELKNKEIEKDERLKICEIESKERIAMKELAYKYARER